MRPLVCLGTHIDIRSQKEESRKNEENFPLNSQKQINIPGMYCPITIPPLGSGWCLMCGNIINLHKASLESATHEIENLAIKAGYIKGLNNPAVFWLNSICASTAVGIIQGMVSGFLDLDSGLDWIYQFPESKWYKTDTNYLANLDCYFCGSEHFS